MNRKNFALLLSKHIEAAGMKQTYVASTASISYNYLQRLLAGDRNPSEQVVQKLAETLHLTVEQTGELYIAAGYAPPVALLQTSPIPERQQALLPDGTSQPDEITRLAQQLYRLSRDVPDTLQSSFLEEMKHLLNYARYKYVLSNGENLLEFNVVDSSFVREDQKVSFNLLAEIVGRLHIAPDEQDTTTSLQEVDDLSLEHSLARSKAAIREIVLEKYQPELIAKLLTMLQEGLTWDGRCHIAKSLPSLCRIDRIGSERLLAILRLDKDETYGADIRRRVVEALPACFEAAPLALPAIINALSPLADDDMYVAIATAEACGTLQTALKGMMEDHMKEPHRKKHPELEEQILALCNRYQAEIPRIQRQLLSGWEGITHECIQFSMALHDLLGAPDTLLYSIREGLYSSEPLLQLVAARYLEHVLLSKPIETLQLYKDLLQQNAWSNVRRTIAKALPKLLHCMKESSLVVRTLARTVIMGLAADEDIYIRRAVADSALQLLSFDREFLLLLLRRMHKDKDQVVRSRLQPVVLQLAQIWLTSYAETAGLFDTKASRSLHSP